MCSGHFQKAETPRSGCSILQLMDDMELTEKKMLWDYLSFVMKTWNGEVIIISDFNEVHKKVERFGSAFNMQGENAFNMFILKGGIGRERKDSGWNKKNNEGLRNNMRNLKSDLAGLDLMIDKCEGDDDVVNKRTNVVKSLRDLEKLQSLEAAQKAEIEWAIKGDEKTKYYQGILNKKRSQLAIRCILVDVNWIESLDLVKREFLSHFKKHFEKPMDTRLHLDMNFSNKLNFDQRADLECEVSKDEIKKQGYFPKGENSSFIALIPKIHDANMVKDFRPISLIGSLYKIIVKILANRFVVVLGNLVNEVQSAFVVDRQILDGPFILNKVVQWCKSKKKKSLVFKVDFEKAYDSVRWDYLDDILRNLGFRDKWCRWIQNCLRSSRGMFKGITLSSSLHLSHIVYADDAIFVGQWNESNIETIVHVLECFHRASGFRINMSKSKLMGISVDVDKVDQAARKIGCVTLKTPFTYLGSNVGGLMSQIQSWKETVEGMIIWLSNWKMKTLSIGGRITLIKSVLGSMPIYHMSLFKVPVKVLQRMKSIRSHFFNGVDLLDSLLWTRVVKAIHGVAGKIGIRAKSSFPSIWLDNVHEVELFKDRASKMTHGNLGYSFRHEPRGGVEHAQFVSMLEKVEGTMLAETGDRWVWSLEGSGEFFVASVRRLIDDNMFPEVASKMRWIKVIPIKVNVHA
nr:RNA-directed DNA polymerase, eukaryota, reverse transcriptase zinc-binding domain protein [Tanacetum cinerariifolium]